MSARLPIKIDGYLLVWSNASNQYHVVNEEVDVFWSPHDRLWIVLDRAEDTWLSGPAEYAPNKKMLGYAIRNIVDRRADFAAGK